MHNPTGTELSSDQVHIISWDKDHFEIRSGEYIIRYHKEKTNGLIFISNTRNKKGKALATNFGLDNAALEILSSSYVKDVSVHENEREIIAELRSSREWADFLIHVRLFKHKPGLINWKVDVSTKGRNEPQKLPFYRFFPQVSSEGWNVSTDQELKFYDYTIDKFVPGRGIDYLRGTPEHSSAWGVRNVYNQFCYLHEEDVINSTVLYFQNFTSLNKYYEITKTDAAYTVDVPYPWISYYPTRRIDFDHGSFNYILKFGYRIPVSEERIPQDEEFTIIDSYLYLNPTKPKNNVECCKLFVKMFSEIYDEIDKPETEYIEWANEVVPKEIENLLDPDNWVTINGKQYLKSYVKDSRNSSAELITLLDVLVPLKKYFKKFNRGLELVERLEKGLPDFYKPELGTILQSLHRAQKIDEEKVVMDAWYFLCPVLWAGHVAEEGNLEAKDMILRSSHAIVKLGHAVSYEFPQFLDIFNGKYHDVLGTEREVYEYDVTGVYAYLMLQYYSLTGDEAYIEEAKKAMDKVAKRSFEYAYEMTATPEGAAAALWLYQLTNDEKYVDLSFIPLASILRHSVFFECKYGYGKYYKTFFLTMAMPESYVAACEEGKVFRYMLEYLKRGEECLPSFAKKLVAELLKYKSQYTMPPNYPKEMIADEPANGKLVPSWYIPFEDLMFGWKKSGQVGQEIYGAGFPIEIANGLYQVFKDGELVLYTEYPIVFSSEENKKIVFRTTGVKEYSFKARIIYLHEKKFPLRVFELDEQGKPVKEIFSSSFDGRFQEFVGYGSATYAILLD
ncbi:MAG: hypothetical protein ACP5LN_09085 [Thermoproteota archaeon]